METHVLIIGAGMTGLAIAHGLKQAGIKYTIFDSEDGIRVRAKEWTMGKEIKRNKEEKEKAL